MIPKGSQRAGGQQLATHLLNEFDNDRVEVAEVRGAIAPDLHGAFAEWSATATGTRCRKYLYSLSVNPDPEQGPLTRDQYRDFIDRAETRLGLAGQPRALVFHVKHGREHCHAIWSRIDTEKMRAVQLSHDRHALRAVVLDFAKDHGLELPRGVTRDRSRDKAPRPKPENLAEKQQEERTGQTRAERVAAITEAWKQSQDGPALVAALEEGGYLLARGDRRAYVVVDRFGEIHALARQIQGVRSKDVKDRLAAFPIDRLPDAKKAQAFARAQREAVAKTASPAKQRAQQRRDELAKAHAERRALVDKKRTSLLDQHKLERETLAEAQEAEKKGVSSKRLSDRPKGLFAFLTRITGIQLIKAMHDRRQDVQRAASHETQTAALERRHSRELQDFERHYRSLHKVEAREHRSLETLLRREEFARIARGPEPPNAPIPPEPPGPPPPSLTDVFRGPATPPEPKAEKAGISPLFNERASGSPEPGSRKRSGKTVDPGSGSKSGGKGSLTQEFESALKRRAAQKRKEKERDRDRRGPRGPGR